MKKLCQTSKVKMGEESKITCAKGELLLMVESSELSTLKPKP